jgi:hypothetical protein
VALVSASLVQMMPEVDDAASPLGTSTPGGVSNSAAASARACAPVSGPSERLRCGGGQRSEVRWQRIMVVKQNVQTMCFRDDCETW